LVTQLLNLFVQGLHPPLDYVPCGLIQSLDAGLSIGARFFRCAFGHALDRLELDDDLPPLFDLLELGDDHGTKPKDGKHHGNGPDLAEDPGEDRADGSHGINLVDLGRGIFALQETVVRQYMVGEFRAQV
jgi:hypothetical protein